ncbi:LCCL domain-containing protein [Pelagibacterium limicola]|uniref:LCCL domain-containing protein n=1 Tax=Pelagibacterium limicola TaxID=2791022 RepID=UPI0018AF6A1D|nr:LCCL domain-containing protein [Pelagibacterium limicola]
MLLSRLVRAGALAALLALGLIGAAMGQVPEACGSYPMQNPRHTCLCPADATPGPVWGSNPYTADSDICTAARHAGVIGAAGGVVNLDRRPGQRAYEGTMQNDVQTSDWAVYHSSYTFVKVPTSGPEYCTPLPPKVEIMTCRCDRKTSGLVWGSGPYAAISDVCAAATHAGVVTGDEQLVTVIAVRGLDRYTGSTRNNVLTLDSDGFNASFIFDGN